MRSEELGRLSLDELITLHVKWQEAGGNGDEGEVPHGGYMEPCCYVTREIQERFKSRDEGRAGETAIASRAQVRAALGKRYAELLSLEREAREEGDIPRARYLRGRFQQIAEDARAILGLAPDAPPPLGGFRMKVQGATDRRDCPLGGGNRCPCERCVVCGYGKHTAIHGPLFGEEPRSAPYGHEFVGNGEEHPE